MSFKDRIVRAMGGMTAGEVKDLVTAEVKRAQQALPVNVDFDPKGQGYRRLTDDDATQRRDQTPVAQATMFELAYWLYDTSGLVKRFVRDTKNFVMGEGVTWTIENDDDGHLDSIFWEFWEHPMNDMAIRLESKVEFEFLLGEACWPVRVNPHNGQVFLSYVDPANIAEVLLVNGYPEMTAAVDLMGQGGRSGPRLTAIRPELDFRSPHYGRLVGDCFFWKLNAPPNASRGRSDLIHLFDFINAFEEGLFDELDRVKQLKAFIWDVLVEGATQEECSKYARSWANPKSGSLRVHNQSVTWDAVSPDMKHADTKSLFDLMKTYLCAAMNRPDSWLGSGGKVYQSEAELQGDPTYKDLASRQRFVQHQIFQVLSFVRDQAIIHGRIKEGNDPYYITVNMPEMSSRDMKAAVTALFQLAQSLAAAETNQWVSHETAAELFASVASQVGVNIDAAAEIQRIAEQEAKAGDVTEDYARQERIIEELTAKIEARMKGGQADEGEPEEPEE